MKILMVCLGNICRSPLAQGIMEDKIRKRGLDWHVDSSGTGAWHVGEKPDQRSINVAKENSIDITHQRARQFSKSDLDHFDVILTMDTSNYRNVLTHTDDSNKYKVKMIMNYLYPKENRSVPDPYYDGGFDYVYNLLDQACDRVIDNLLNDSVNK